MWWNGKLHLDMPFPGGFLLSSSSGTFDLGSLISQLPYFYVEKREKCRATNMQIRNAPWAALTTLESESRSSALSRRKARVVSTVSMHTVCLEFSLRLLLGKYVFLKPLVLGDFHLVLWTIKVKPAKTKEIFSITLSVFFFSGQTWRKEICQNHSWYFSMRNLRFVFTLLTGAQWACLCCKRWCHLFFVHQSEFSNTIPLSIKSNQTTSICVSEYEYVMKQNFFWSDKLWINYN